MQWPSVTFSDMEDLAQAAKGISLMAIAWVAHIWALIYPLATGLTTMFALIMTAHAVCRLVWRWWHGYSNFLSDGEVHRD